MRILIATPFYPPQSGVLAVYAEGIEQALQKQGHSVDVIVFDSGFPTFIKHIVFFFRVCIHAFRADAVLSLDLLSAGIPSYYAARCARVPWSVRIGGDPLWEMYVNRTKKPVRLSDVYSEHEHFSGKERIVHALMRIMLRGAHTLFFTTTFQKKLWEREYGFDDSRTVHLENYFGVPERVSSAPKGFVFVSTSRENALKNNALLLRAFERITTTHPEVELDTRMLPHAEHQARLVDAYAVIVPSLSEVSSNTAIDAVQAGKPFIMSNDTGTSERLAGCGIYIDMRDDEEALVASIEKLLDPAVYARYREAVHEYTFTHSWDDIAEEIVGGLLRQAL